tara:strand:- start:32 stop:568 length:537 start_codon:yes stop_codon:yes gene_type:complete
MAEPNDRRVIWGSHVIPQDEYTNPGNQETLEEGMTVGIAAYTDFRLDPTIGKTFGGKGNTTITTEQSRDSWTSMMHEKHYWETHNEVYWEAWTETWDGELYVTSGVDIDNRSGKCKFLYMKNTGDTNDVELSLDNGSNYFILIPPGGAVSMRPNDAVVNIADVQVQSTGTTIEFVIAK